MLENAFEIPGKGENKILLLSIGLWNPNYKIKKNLHSGSNQPVEKEFSYN